MTKLRATFSLVACATALAVSAAATSAQQHDTWVDLDSIQMGATPSHNDLPPPPRLPPGTMSITGDYSLDGPAPTSTIANAPQPAPGPQSPQRFRKRIDKSTPLLAK
jgi:hypothetical protein